jgi:hypothetical protein
VHVEEGADAEAASMYVVDEGEGAGGLRWREDAQHDARPPVVDRELDVVDLDSSGVDRLRCRAIAATRARASGMFAKSSLGRCSAVSSGSIG